MNSVDLVRVADLWEQNQEYLKQRLGRSESAIFGAHWVLMPDAPYPRFNHVSCIRIDAEDVNDLLATARLFFQAQGLPTSCLMVTPATQPHDLGTRLGQLGFAAEPNAVMIWDGTPILASPDVRVERATEDQAPLVFEVIRRIFFAHASESSLAAARRSVKISFEEDAINYLAYWGGQLAGAGMLFPRGEMGGIYNMCTLPQFRGRGVATSILAQCLADAQQRGCTYVGLTPTDQGRALYRHLGFREAYQELYYFEALPVRGYW